MSNLPKDQQEELKRWRHKLGEYAGRKSTPEDKSWGGKNSSSSNVSALVQKKVAAKLRKLKKAKSKKRKEDESNKDEMKAMMVACLEELVSDSKPSAKKVKFSAGSTHAEPIASPETTIAVSQRKRPVIPSLNKILQKAREHMSSKSSST